MLPDFIHRPGGEWLYLPKPQRQAVNLVDESISLETRARALLHEAHHAVSDLPASGYVLGVDEQRTIREQSAEEYAVAK